MTLVDRVSTIFLAALALVLIVYSALFWAIARHDLNSQFDQELSSALGSIVAAVEVEDEDVSWQPTEHTLNLGSSDDVEQVRWAVIGDDFRLVDSSRNSSPTFLEHAKLLASRTSTKDSSEQITIDDWRYITQRLEAPAPDRELRDFDEYDAVVIVVGKSTAVLSSTTLRLTALVCLLPISGWLLAAAVGRRLCRRALQPLLEMSQTVRSMSAANFAERLTANSAPTELASFADAFNGLLDRLQHSYESQRRFTGDAAHELRTPLTVLLGQIEVALRKSRSPDEYRSTLDLLHHQAVELREILESLLFLARAESTDEIPDRQHFDLGDWAQRYLEHWNEHPRRADLSLQSNGAVPVNTSPTLLARSVDNLVSNGLKYSAPGAPVILKIDRTGNDALLSVHDQGPGIPGDELPHLFEPFYRSARARQSGAPGVGLGLAVASRIATAIGARINCESEPGRGSTFFLRMPLATP